MNPVWLRLAFIIEFLLAIPAVFTLWSQIGGQGHLDLMPWYWKLLLGGGGAIAIVRFTAAVIGQERVWSSRARFWFAALLILAAGMALLTYYYHLQESPDDSGDDSTTASLLMAHGPR
jgi:hypothetical protein